MSLKDNPAFVLAVDAHRAGRFMDARGLYQQLLEEHPEDPDIWHFKGLLALHMGEPEEAIRLITLAIVLKPGMPDYFQNLGLAYAASGDQVKAGQSFNKQGNALQEQCRFTDALAAYDQGLAVQPGFTSILMNKGAALDRLGRYAEAAALFEMVIGQDRNPAEPDAILNLANAFSGLGRAEEAIEQYSRLIDLQPDNATPHCSRALLQLRLGQFDRGWNDYEWRWVREGGFKEPRGLFKQPVWQGGTPEELGGPLLVIAEQGLGDVIQFARYVPLLAEQGFDVIFETLPPLLALFRDSFTHPNIRVIPRIDNPLKVEGDLPFIAWVGVMSLPLRFNTTLETIPAQVPYVTAVTESVEEWRGRLLAPSPPSGGEGRDEGLSASVNAESTPHPYPLPLRRRGSKRVGIVWAGNPKNLNDFARSISASMLEPLLKAEGIRWYSLQKGPAVADIPPGMIDLDPYLTDFTETAAAIMNLDLVIAVDTSVAHLAGALGKSVWLMIPCQPDWRWLNEGKTTNWYPTMRIFRQSVRGQWGDVIEAVLTELNSL